MTTPRVDLTIIYGPFGEKSKTVTLSISELLAKELMEGVERSDEPFSQLLASPGLWGGKGDAVTIKRKKFQMRRDIAEDIAQLMVPALLKAFGVNDKLDGYRIEKMSEEEKEWQVKQGRISDE